jgi:hypothetical protein
MYNRYLWIRIALIHRLLNKIVEYIVSNSSYVFENFPFRFIVDSLLGNFMNHMHLFAILFKDRF